MTKVLICGFGRMGISHALQTLGNFSSFGRKVELYICDPSFVSRLVAVFVCPSAYFIKTDKLASYRSDYFHYAIDCTPPSFRNVLVPILQRIAQRVLVEKPVVIELEPSSMSGYVLQHNPLLAELGSLVSKAIGIKVELITNVDFTAGGWRGGKGGGLANEYLGHCLSVPAALFPQLANAKIVNLSAEGSSIAITIEAEHLTIECNLHANRNDVRKASYSWRFFNNSEVVSKNEFIEFDLYQITRWRDRSREVVSGVAQLGISVPFYLRGFDFARQNNRFIKREGDVFDKGCLRTIERLVSEVAEVEYENRFRG